MRFPVLGYGRLTGRVSVLAALTALSIGASAQTTTQLRLVSTAWPPFTNDPGQHRFALDLIETALGRVGVKTNTTIVEAARYTTSLLEGPFDGSAAAWRDPERERVLMFSRPYLENRLVLIGRRGSDVSAKTFADLKGKRIAIVEGYSYGDAIDQAGPTFVRSRSEEDSLARLLKSEVDYTLMDELVVQYIVDNHANEARKRLQLASTPLIVRELYFAVRQTVPKAQAIVDGFNAQLRTMISDRTYHRLLHVDWIRADVDGDGLAENVPKSDQAGPTEPQRSYDLFASTRQALPEPNKPQRYYIGGKTYSSWAAVPDMYKVIVGDRPDPSLSTVKIFQFTW